MKLYPPYIEGTLPAFHATEKGTAIITVPFSMNKAVNKSQVIGFYAKVKTVQNNKLLFTIHSENYEMVNKNEVYFELSQREVAALKIGSFYKIQIAYQSKEANNTVGYYSTVATVKYTSKPGMEIVDLTQGSVNLHRYSYTGRYSQSNLEYKIVKLDETTYKPDMYYVFNGIEYVLCADKGFNSDKAYYQVSTNVDIRNKNFKDTTEKEYQYRFVLYDRNDNIIQDTQWQLHNHSNDLTSYYSTDTCTLQTDLDPDMLYYLQYSVITNNKMVVSTPKYRLIQRSAVAPEINAKIKAELNFNNGYMDVFLVGNQDEDGNETATSGNFIVTRACDEDGYKTWNEVYRFTLRGSYPSRHLYKDFTIEQGKNYIYGLQQYNSSGYRSSRITTDIIFADFEDAFLYDGTRQLKIKYNPKISSFKTTKLETKKDTIGSKYPFFFRNGNVDYKEFPFSGLISYHSDEENLFMKDSELGFFNEGDNIKRPLTNKHSLDDEDYFFQLEQDVYNYNDAIISRIKEGIKERNRHDEILSNNRTKTLNLVGYNYSAERIFKLEVLDWLNDGKPKLFKSPSEGNYIIRLMNISLTPEDILGRMIHSFSGTAYEVAECTYDALSGFGIITVEDISEQTMIWGSVQLATKEDKSLDERYSIDEGSSIFYLKGDYEILPRGRQAITVRFEDMLPQDLIKIKQANSTEYMDIRIGTTGFYEINTGVEITSIIIPEETMKSIKMKGSTGIISYSYYDDKVIEFNEVSSININSIPVVQYIGDSTKTVSRCVRETDLVEFKKDKNVVKQSLASGCEYHYVVEYNTNNIIEQIENIKTKLNSFYFLHFFKRDCQQVFLNPTDKQLYRESYFQNPLFGYICVYLNAESYVKDKYYIRVDNKYEICTEKDYDKAKTYYEYVDLTQQLDNILNYENRENFDPFRCFYYEVDTYPILHQDRRNYVPSTELDKNANFYLKDTEDYSIKWANVKDVLDFAVRMQQNIYYYKDNIRKGVPRELVNLEQLMLKVYQYKDYSVITPNIDYVKQKLYDENTTIIPNALIDEYYNKWIFGIDFYLQAPFIMIYDPLRPDKVIMDKFSYDSLMAEVGARNMGGIVRYSNEIEINGSYLDLEDIQTYDIRGPIVLNSVSLSDGVGLECGYDVQETVYSIELTDRATAARKTRVDEEHEKITAKTMELFCESGTVEIVVPSNWNEDRDGPYGPDIFYYDSRLNPGRTTYKREKSNYISYIDQRKAYWSEYEEASL